MQGLGSNLIGFRKKKRKLNFFLYLPHVESSFCYQDKCNKGCVPSKKRVDKREGILNLSREVGRYGERNKGLASHTFPVSLLLINVHVQ